MATFDVSPGSQVRSYSGTETDGRGGSGSPRSPERGTTVGRYGPDPCDRLETHPSLVSLGGREMSYGSSSDAPRTLPRPGGFRVRLLVDHATAIVD
jgi:hypothetical protein